MFQDFALVLLLLLRENFLSATDHSDMRAVFLHEPSKLLTADIQRAWLMIHEKASYRDVSHCNRLNQLVSGGQPPNSNRYQYKCVWFI